MTDQKPLTSVIRFSRDLRCGTFEPEYDYVDLCKIDDGRYAVLFDCLTPETINVTNKVDRLDHHQWKNLGPAQPASMSCELARKWVRQKVSRLFEEPPALWGG